MQFVVGFVMFGMLILFYSVFGEVKIEDFNVSVQVVVVQQFVSQFVEYDYVGYDYFYEGYFYVVKEEEEDDGEEVDVEGIEDKDIEFVMIQVNVFRKKVIKVLKENDNDIVNLIMVLSVQG